MTVENRLSAPKRRTRAEVQELVAELMSGGPKIAAILSVVESCRRLKISVRDYLASILPGLADLPIRRLPDLTPAAWVVQHSWTQATGLLA
jgi:hypothetical protein